MFSDSVSVPITSERKRQNSLTGIVLDLTLDAGNTKALDACAEIVALVCFDAGVSRLAIAVVTVEEVDEDIGFGGCGRSSLHVGRGESGAHGGGKEADEELGEHGCLVFCLCE